MAPSAYVDFRMQEWRMDEYPARLQACVRKVLGELSADALLWLKDPKFEVLPAESGHSVWAYFPIHRKRLIAQKLRLKPETRVLMVFSIARFEDESEEQFEDYLRDHLGHVLLYLREPSANNDCSAAMKEWRRSILAKNGACQ